MKMREGMVDRALMALARNRRTALILFIAGMVAMGAGLLLVIIL